MSFVELLIDGYCFDEYELLSDRHFIPLEIKAILYDFYGYNQCCIAVRKKRIPKIASIVDLLFDNDCIDMELMWKCYICKKFLSVNNPSNQQCLQLLLLNFTDYVPNNDEFYWKYKNVICQNGDHALITKNSYNHYMSETVHITVALYSSIAMGHVSCFKYLKPRYYPLYNNHSVLWHAARYNQPKMIKLLLNPKMNPYHELNINDTSKPWLFKHKRMDSISTPLMIACYSGSIHAVQTLLKLPDIKVNIKGGIDQNETALIIACRRNKYHSVKALLKHPYILINETDTFQRSALWLATVYGYYHIVQLLLDQLTIDVDCRDLKNWTPLFIACKRGWRCIVQLLLDKNVCFCLFF